MVNAGERMQGLWLRDALRLLKVMALRLAHKLLGNNPYDRSRYPRTNFRRFSWSEWSYRSPESNTWYVSFFKMIVIYIYICEINSSSLNSKIFQFKCLYIIMETIEKILMEYTLYLLWSRVLQDFLLRNRTKLCNMVVLSSESWLAICLEMVREKL